MKTNVYKLHKCKFSLNLIFRIQTDLEELNNEMKNADDKARRAADDAQRLQMELRSEQEHSNQIEKLRKGLEQQIKEMQVRLDEAEAQTLKGGKKMIAKLESRVSHLLTTTLDNVHFPYEARFLIWHYRIHPVSV